VKPGAWIAAGLLASSICAGTRSAAADDVQTRAARAFAEGEKAFATGDYGRAAKLFEEAYAVRPHPSSLANAAKARRLMGDLAGAANHYRRLEEEATTAHDTQEAHTALAEIRTSLGHLILEANADASPSVDGAALRSKETFVEPGEHVVEATSGKGSVRRVVRVAAGETRSVVLTTPLRHADPDSKEKEHAPSAERPAPPLSPFVTLGLIGATLVVSGVTVWSGLDTLDQRRAWDASPSNRELDAGLVKQERTNVLIAVSVGLGVLTGVAAIFTDWSAAPLGGSKRARATGFSF
jgi:hypothetical protein